MYAAVVPAGVRFAELLGGLSLACDLADGFPPEKVLRTALLAVEIARHHGLDDELARDAFYVSFLRYTGCTAFAHEEAHIYGAGDDIGTRSVMALADAARPLSVVGGIVRGIGAGASAVERVRAVARMLGDPAVVAKHAHSQCETSVRFARLLGLGEAVRAALRQICERWDGKGNPQRAAGDALSMAMRLSHVADVAEIAHHRDGREACVAFVRRCAGGWLDPALAATFLANADELLGSLEGPSVWERCLDAEPRPFAQASEARLDDVATLFAHMVDLKSTFTLGHSTGVADLAVRAAATAVVGSDEATLLRRAALLHDVGRACVPNSVWDKPGRLSAGEWERVRLHAYYTERIVWRAPALRELAAVAAAGHERLDGHGYHRGLPASLLPKSARLLAAADAWHAMSEPRPHRAALDPNTARKNLLDDVASGRLDRDAVSAVLEAASGFRPRVPAAWPAGLSDREVEVLRLVARGRSNKEIAVALDISPRTVQHHVEHVYGKIEVSSRAAAALFATENGLLG